MQGKERRHPTGKAAAKGANKEATHSKISLEETINMSVLKSMKDLFEKADQDGGGFLDMEEFVGAFRGVESTYFRLIVA